MEGSASLSIDDYQEWEPTVAFARIAVFPDGTQGTLPDYRTETEAALSEERRACFVGVCRAESHLTLTRIEQYRGFRKPPSIFLEEMGLDPYE